MSRRAEQIEELEGFLSMLECFDGSLEYDSPQDALITGKIRIDLPLLDAPVVVFVEDGNDIQSREARALEHCVLHFTLPDEYPSVAPSIDIECSWMSKEKCDSMMKVVEETAVAYEDQPMLYAIAYAVRENACLNLDQRIRVDNTPYCVAHNITGPNILYRLVEASANIEQAVFERECHDCEVCWENEPGSRCVRFLPCRHVFCATCVQQHFLIQLKSEGIRTFECLGDACSSFAAQDVVRKSIGEEEYERYDSILLDRVISAMNDKTLCPREGCGSYASVNANNRQLGTCDACAFPFCVECRKTYHGVEKCSDQSEALILMEQQEKDQNAQYVAAVLQRQINKLKNDKWVRENSKKCPNCKTDIEKTEGCNKMHCNQCGTAFCWICLENLNNAEDPYRHFTPSSGGECANRLMDRVEVENEDQEADAVIVNLEGVDNIDEMEEIIAGNGINLYENYADYAYVKPESSNTQEEEGILEDADDDGDAGRRRDAKRARGRRRR